MNGKPINRIHADDLLNRFLTNGKGKFEKIKEEYRCRFYVEAIGIQDTLRQMTGKDYGIIQDGVMGWIVREE